MGEFGAVVAVLRVEIRRMGELFEGIAVVAFGDQGPTLAELDFGVEEIGLDAKGVGCSAGALLVGAAPSVEQGLPSIGIGEIAVGACAG